jgi:hypothetical protein
MGEIARREVARAVPEFGDTMRVEVVDFLAVGPDAIVMFRGLDDPAWERREVCTEQDGWRPEKGLTGVVTLAYSRAVRGGRWVFAPDEIGQGG